MISFFEGPSKTDLRSQKLAEVQDYSEQEVLKFRFRTTQEPYSNDANETFNLVQKQGLVTFQSGVNLGSDREYKSTQLSLNCGFVKDYRRVQLLKEENKTEEAVKLEVKIRTKMDNLIEMVLGDNHSFVSLQDIVWELVSDELKKKILRMYHMSFTEQYWSIKGNNNVGTMGTMLLIPITDQGELEVNVIPEGRVSEVEEDGCNVISIGATTTVGVTDKIGKKLILGGFYWSPFGSDDTRAANLEKQVVQLSKLRRNIPSKLTRKELTKKRKISSLFVHGDGNFYPGIDSTNGLSGLNFLKHIGVSSMANIWEFLNAPISTKERPPSYRASLLNRNSRAMIEARQQFVKAGLSLEIPNEPTYFHAPDKGMVYGAIRRIFTDFLPLSLDIAITDWKNNGDKIEAICVGNKYRKFTDHGDIYIRNNRFAS
jgi:hypothetical protein